jgi:hypothetical protein
LVQRIDPAGFAGSCLPEANLKAASGGGISVG